MEAYSICNGLDGFCAAREHFNFLIDCLSSEEMASAEHGDVERVI